MNAAKVKQLLKKPNVKPNVLKRQLKQIKKLVARKQLKPVIKK